MTYSNYLTSTRIPNCFNLSSNAIDHMELFKGDYGIGIKSGYQYDTHSARSCLTPGDDGQNNETTNAPSRWTTQSEIDNSFVVTHEWFDFNKIVVYDSSKSDIPTCSISVLNEEGLIDFGRVKSGNPLLDLENTYTYLHTQRTILCLNANYPDILTESLVLLIDFGFLPSYPRYEKSAKSLRVPFNMYLDGGYYQRYDEYKINHGGNYVFTNGYGLINYDNLLNTYRFGIDIWVYDVKHDDILIENTDSNGGYIITGKSIKMFEGTNQFTFEHNLYSSDGTNGYNNLLVSYNGNTLSCYLNNSLLFATSSSFQSNVSSPFIVGDSVNKSNFTIVSLKVYNDYIKYPNYNYPNEISRYSTIKK